MNKSSLLETVGGRCSSSNQAQPVRPQGVTAKSKDPDKASSAMPHQGVLTKDPLLSEPHILVIRPLRH
jgi:hypothetical protein